MILKKEILNIILAATFSLALLFPTAIKFVHTFENHKHEVCTDFSVHIHKQQLDCSIWDFHFSIFTFETQNLPDFAIIHRYQTEETNYFLQDFTINKNNYLLRGPPLFS